MGSIRIAETIVSNTPSSKSMDELNQIIKEQGKNKSLQTLLHELGYGKFMI